jgi:putative molybdopterin biosynthesis protein
MPRTRYLNKKSLAEALRLFVGDAPPLARPAEVVPVEDSLHRVTASQVFALISAPHYHGSAMDGIAVRAADTFGASERTPVTLTKLAGDRAPTPAVAAAFQYVDTGHPLPAWADAVIMVEQIYPVDGEHVSIRAAAAPWQHVRLVGEDIVATEPLLPRGHRIRPFDIGALLAAGHVTVPLAPRPRVAILATGSELIDPGDEPRAGSVIEFNSRVIAGFVHEWGGEPCRLPRIEDDLDAITAAIAEAARSHDVVAIIAGSSAGEHDYTVHAVGRLGEVLVHGIEIMPGKPAICARVGATPVLGVPGYPVSAIIVCQQILRPLLARLLGTAPEAPPTVRAVVPRKMPSRLGLEEFMRVTLGRVGDTVVANPLGRGAGVITTMVKADGFLRIPALSEGVNAGETVDVELLRPASTIERTIVFSGSHDLSIGVLEDRLKRLRPELQISATNVGSLGGLLALKRGEAHAAGTHLLDPATGTYNLPDIQRHLADFPVVVMNLVVREQGLIVATGNPRCLGGLEDLTRDGVRFVNRQPGAGTRVLLDFKLGQLGIRADDIPGYQREEFTHMAVAVAVASGLADCGLGVRSAAAALGLDFIPIEREDYDVVLRRDFLESALGEALLAAIRSEGFRRALGAMPGYDTARTGEFKAVATLRTPRDSGLVATRRPRRVGTRRAPTPKSR